ncbi:zinc-binding alcohol dehydrogenase family protein [Ideonella dechloratans]|uniref:zinc-binding alcohol dehydrogenase family protein n=1 Tax=Ideonella dechloratans TaxID=36863 RepID=UPI0035ADCFC2
MHNTLTHRAAVLDGFKQPLRIGEVVTPAPGPYEVRVRVRALALNPYDRIVQTLGGLIVPKLKFPAVLGSDVAGDVVAIGEGCRRLRVGDRVMGLALGTDRVANRLQEGAFQEQVLLREDCCCRLPDSIPYAGAAVLPLALSTAASALFLGSQLDLASPPISPTAHATADTTVIVWGGATSVGSVAIQLARAAGHRVLSTASPGNHARTLHLGAHAVEDYRDKRAVDRLFEATGESTVVGLLAIGSGSGKPCVELARRFAVRPKVAMVSAPVPLDDAPIGSQGWWRLQRLPRLAIGLAGLAIGTRRAGIPTSSVWGTALVEDPLGKRIFTEFAEAALADGRLVPAPEPWIQGLGLEDIPAAIEALRHGISARKIVIVL